MMGKFPSAWRDGLEGSKEDRRAERIEAETGCSAVSRRFSPDMQLRWMPTVDGQIIASGTLPFSGFDTRAEAIKAAQEYATVSRPPRETPCSHAPIICLDGKWHCQKCGDAIEMAVAHPSHHQPPQGE